MSSILGRGWNFPLEYDNGAPEVVEDVDSVKAAIRALFSTSPGERFMEPSYGSRVVGMLFEGVRPQTLQLLEVYAEEDIETWIPRIARVRAHAQLVAEHQVQLTIEFRLIGNPTPETMVFPFYVE